MNYITSGTSIPAHLPLLVECWKKFNIKVVFLLISEGTKSEAVKSDFLEIINCQRNDVQRNEDLHFQYMNKFSPALCGPNNIVPINTRFIQSGNVKYVSGQTTLFSTDQKQDSFSPVNTKDVSILQLDFKKILINKAESIQDIKQTFDLMYLDDVTNRLFLYQEILLSSYCINKVFILHYTKLVERKQTLIKHLQREKVDTNIDIVWIENFDREDLTTEQINSNYIANSQVLPRQLSLGEIANGIGHKHILNSVRGICLVLEDDMLLCNNFLMNLYSGIDSVPSNWDVIGVGGYSDDIKPEIKDGNYFVETKELRMIGKDFFQTGGFVIKESFVNKIKNEPFIHPTFCTPIDYTLRIICSYTNPVIYWFDPLIAYEGSKVDLYSTSFKERGW